MLNYVIDTRDKDFSKMKSMLDKLLSEERQKKRACSIGVRESYVFDDSDSLKYTEYMYTFSDKELAQGETPRVAPKYTTVSDVSSSVSNIGASISVAPQTESIVTAGVASYPTYSGSNPAAVDLFGNSIINAYTLTSSDYMLTPEGDVKLYTNTGPILKYSIPVSILQASEQERNTIRSALISATNNAFTDVSANTVLVDFARFKGATYAWTTLGSSFIYPDDEPNPNNPFNMSNKQYREAQAANSVEFKSSVPENFIGTLATNPKTTDSEPTIINPPWVGDGA